MSFPAAHTDFDLKFMRIAISKPTGIGPEKYFLQKTEAFILNCKIFVPAKLVTLSSSGSATSTEYENVNATKRKMQAWIQTTGAKVLGCQTAVVKLPYSTSSLAASVDSAVIPKTGSFLWPLDSRLLHLLGRPLP
jgi:hypothetical protein